MFGDRDRLGHRLGHRFGWGIARAALGAAILASPVAATSPAPRTPAPEMAQLGFFVGSFACKGETDATPMSAPHPISRTITGRMDLDDFWLFMRFEDKRTTENPTPIRGNWQLIYDAKAKNFAAVWTDNLGRWFPQTSSGWEGDTIAFTGDFVLDDKKGTVRDTFIKKSDRDMVMRVDVQTDGVWRRFFQLDCRK